MDSCSSSPADALSVWDLAADLLDPPPPVQVDPVDWIHGELGEETWSKQDEILRAIPVHRKTAVASCHGVGKATAVDTPLPTPTGWTKMADVQVGDELLSESGHPCRVLGTAEWGDRPCYRVTFDDGTSVVADAEHEWSVTTFRSRANRRMRVGVGVADWRDEHATLSQIVTTRGLRAGLRTAWGQRDIAVPLTRPLVLPEGDLPVDPYLLGIFLADGTRADGGITVATSEAWWIERRIGGHRIPSSERATSFVLRVPGLKVKLRNLGALNPKRIPTSYLRGSYAQRLGLLHGVMDGDGFARESAAGIDLTHEVLAMDVLELMRSLGLRPTVRAGPATLNGRRVGTRWRISVTPTIPVFSLPSKLRERPGTQACRYTQRMVTLVEPVAPRATKCVEVDSPSRLYLCGEGMVPTHNSWLASRAAAWWIASHPPGEAKVVTSAPSQDQVRKILWNEIRQAHSKGGLPGSISMSQIPEWTIDGQIVAFGRKGADRVDANTARTLFQGIHARYLLVILDEACGIPEWLWDAVMSLTTGEDGRVLAIGNPDDPVTRFAKHCAPGSDWNVMHVSAFDTPAFTGEPVSDYLRASLVSRQYVEDAEKEWGVESPLYISKVLGEFPEVSDDVIITPRMVRLAQERDLSGNAIGARRRFGMDVARMGADESCIYEYRGGMIRLVEAWRKTDVDTSRAKAQRLLEEPVNRYTPMTVDVVGLGAGVVDPLRNAGFPVRPFSGGSQAANPERFVNLNAEAWWAMRELMEAGLIDLDPQDLKLAAQLQSRKWRLDSSQRRIEVESKDKMRERGIASPDRADGAIMATYELRVVDDPGVVMHLEPNEVMSITGDLLGMPT